jgi:2-polyprenyl-3-methyl-5-hydroxy-6-metoxy-1,4-benzoquinol methylase
MSDVSVHGRDVDLGTIQSFPGAAIRGAPNDSLEICTAAAPWAYAALLPLSTVEVGAEAVGISASIDVEVVTGLAGLFLTDSAAQQPLAPEMSLGPASGRTTVRLDAPTARASRLCIRTGVEGPAHLRIYRLQSWARRRFDVAGVIDDLMPLLLKSSNGRRLELVAAALSRERCGRVSADEIGALASTRSPIAVPFDTMWDDPAGLVIAAATRQLTALLPTYDPTKMDARAGYQGRDYFTKFFRQSTVRVYHLAEQLREMGMTSGSVLEIGSLFGQFVLSLQRLGYETTAVDRYRAYDGAYTGYTAYLRAAGVNVIETDRTDEADIIAALGRFDAVIAMAVIEHIPHTPRHCVEMLATHVRPGGLLLLDTPNIARYWNRKQLADGVSIHPAIADQFYAPSPFEGHHREYTAAEIAWILEQVGCADIRTRLFDYNVLQFQELWPDQMTAFLASIVDSTLADTVLVGGRCP